jgi:hypothetical protein
VQAARIAKKEQRQSSRNAQGVLRFDGPILRQKGDCYFVDVNVTGSAEGISDKPKFALRSLFEKTVFPRIAELIQPGGAYAGYIPNIQGDNAGPHQDGDFVSFCKNHCADNGWRWQPQAPQMPYMNNLDLTVFPSMSRRHNVLLRQSATNTVQPDKIWEAVERVCRDLESCAIARGFALAYRVAALVIKHKGSNNFLHEDSFHSGVRRDFSSQTKVSAAST